MASQKKSLILVKMYQAKTNNQNMAMTHADYKYGLHGGCAVRFPNFQPSVYTFFNFNFHFPVFTSLKSLLRVYCETPCPGSLLDS